MKRDEILKKLKEAEAALRKQGVEHAALFDSVARGDDRSDSDIDIVVALDQCRAGTLRVTSHKRLRHARAHAGCAYGRAGRGLFHKSELARRNPITWPARPPPRSRP